MALYGLGAVPSPEDPRDHILSASMIQSAAAGIVVPDDFLMPGMPPHLNQGKRPLCTTFAGNQMKRWQEKKDRHGVRVYDQERMYAWQKQVDGINGDGSTGRAWCEVARKRGIPLEGQFQGVDKIAGYWKVDIGGDWEALKVAVYVFGPVMIGGEFPNNWFVPKGGIVPPPAGGIAGGHEMLVCGYKSHHPAYNRALTFLDWGSWGNYKGSTGGGNFWVPITYLSEVDKPGTVQVWEMWKSKDVLGD